jgi:L-2-amino-thiazoline-4-carboxylic acid hydrolase
MANKDTARDDRTILFGLGLATGLLGGLAFRRFLARPRRMRKIEIWQQAMAETRGEVEAAFLAAKVEVRYDELYAHRPHFALPALREHLETGILPGLALYQTLSQELGDSEAALAELDSLFEAWLQHAPMQKQVQLLKYLPDPFAALRVANRLVLKKSFPPEGWTIEWIEDNNNCVAFNIHDCFYLKVLTVYGAPELTSHFCRGDDLLYGNLPGISWERNLTIGRGDPICNFRFCRATIRQA